MSAVIASTVIATSLGGGLDPCPRSVAAASSAGGTGVLDLGEGGGRARGALAEAAAWADAPIGVRIPAGCRLSLDEIERAGAGRVALVVLPAGSHALAAAAARYPVLVEVTSIDQARAAKAGGAHGLIARGMEAGGRVGELSAFVLLQQLLADDELDLPVWVCGGIGPDTAAACVVGGARGVVLDSQLALLPESDLPDDVLALLRRIDGTETVVDGTLLSGQYRGLRRPSTGELLPIGQDGWLADAFARRFTSTAGAVRAIDAAIRTALADHAAGDLLAPGSPLAQALGVRLPVAQGPMTRVSDEAGFAAAVAEHGALPFIALALAGPDQCRATLRQTAALLRDQPWGVGVLGFVPEQLRAAQVEVVREVRPACAIIAGGRPAQAAALEAEGISTFLHVPSPVLLRQFLRAGSRKFVFEGAECGGHVGPRASFPLWEAQLHALHEFLDQEPAAGEQLQVFFAGGVHDQRSAAMVSALAAPLARRGAKVGVLMGTAYLFTEEAVHCGAIQPRFQREAVAATATSLLETAPGHATRCLPSPYVDDFHRVRGELAAAGVADRQVWERLEMLNVGRLRIASKGLRRDGDQLVQLDEATQAAEGLFMAGQVAVLRDAPTTLARLHASVTTGAGEFYTARVAASRAQPAP
ncbi:MAG: nitronate monooxygenase, partial [Micromonosporaceae bacterium]|nr:nitronate monooxygenase [Micromonosporaceae bacterium]